MDIMTCLLLVFGWPLATHAVVAAIAGFFCRPVQILMLGAGAAAVVLLCMGFAASDGMVAPFLILPLAATYALAAAASLLLTRWMECDYRQEAALRADDGRP